MRITHIANHFLPSAGGVEWSVLRTAEAQAAMGDRVCVITETPKGSFDDSALPFEVQRFHVPVRRPITRVFYWRWMWMHREQLRKADVLHFHDYTPLIHWFFPLRFLIRGPRYAITFHGFEHWPVRFRHRLLRAVAARMCHIRFAVGAYVREIYHHPVDAVYLGAAVRDYPRMTPPEDMRFVFAGRLERDTGIDVMVEELSRVAEAQGVAVQLEVAGEGSLRPALEQLRNAQLDIVFHGRLEDPLPLLQRARFVIATGYLGMFEAFQCGLPVLTPALTEIKQRYVASLPDAESMLTVMRSRGDMRAVLQQALTAELYADFLTRAARATQFVSEHTWRDIASLLASWYGRGGKGEEGTILEQRTLEDKH